MGGASALDIEALIGRSEQFFHSERLRPVIAEKTVLVTGAAGSITQIGPGLPLVARS